MMGSVVRLTRCCASCAIEFRPARPTHRYCSTCYAWTRIGAMLRRLRESLAAIGVPFHGLTEPYHSHDDRRPSLPHAREILDKARRERHRYASALDCKDRIAAADHVFNLTVTIESIPDWVKRPSRRLQTALVS
jgi:hypothetical protein